MKRLLQLSASFMMIACGIFFLRLSSAAANVSAAASGTHDLVLQLRGVVSSVDGRLNGKGGLMDVAQATMLHVDRATGEAAATSVQERAYLKTTSGKIIALLSDADDAVKNADSSRAAAAGDLHASFATLNSSLIDLSALLKQGNQTMASADALISNPALTSAVANFDSTSRNLAAASGSVSKGADLLEKKAEALAKPASLAKTIFVGALDTAYKLFSFFK